MNKTLLLLAIFLASVLLLAGCASKSGTTGQDGKTPAPAPSPTPAPSAVMYSVGEGDQKVAGEDVKTTEEDEDAKELEKMLADLE